jgi:hypothetical protein
LIILEIITKWQKIGGKIEPPAHWVMQKSKTSHGITNSISFQIHQALITWVSGQQMHPSCIISFNSMIYQLKPLSPLPKMKSTMNLNPAITIF